MKIALLLLFAATNHWIRVSSKPFEHHYYVNPTGNVLGEYYHPKDGPYTAQCYEGKPAEFATEPEAVAFVLKCPVW